MASQSIAAQRLAEGVATATVVGSAKLEGAPRAGDAGGLPWGPRVPAAVAALLGPRVLLEPPAVLGAAGAGRELEAEAGRVGVAAARVERVGLAVHHLRVGTASMSDTGVLESL